MELQMSSTYHPQTNGQTEAVNKYLECYLRCITREKPKEWVNGWHWLSFGTTQSFIAPQRLLFKFSMVKHPLRLMKLVCLLIQWLNCSKEDATWESYEDTASRFSYSSLDPWDKDVVKGKEMLANQINWTRVTILDAPNMQNNQLISPTNFPAIFTFK